VYLDTHSVPGTEQEQLEVNYAIAA
jgi:hypothetical protein